MHHPWVAGVGVDLYKWTILPIFISLFIFLFFCILNIDFFNQFNSGYLILEKCCVHFTSLLFSCGVMLIKCWDFSFITSKCLCQRLVNIFFFIPLPKLFFLKCGFDHYETSLHSKHKHYASYCF